MTESLKTKILREKMNAILGQWTFADAVYESHPTKSRDSKKNIYNRNRTSPKIKPFNTMTLAQKKQHVRDKLRQSGRLTTDPQKLARRDEIIQDVIKDMPTITE